MELMEKRLLDTLEPEGFVRNQYGFRKGHSTVQALECVQKVAEGGYAGEEFACS